MKKTYRNKLPKDMEVVGTGVSIENGELVVEVEMKERFEPKDGDFCVDADGDVFIVCTERSDISFIGAYIGENKDLPRPFYFNGVTYTKDCRYATLEEKAKFLERLEKEYHKKWNPEKKQIEDIRWRASYGCFYFFIDSYFCVNKEYDFGGIASSKRHEVGNYFRTIEAAQKVADQMKEIFKNSKAE